MPCLMFQLLGAVLIGVGSWGFNEKQRYGEGASYHEDFDFYKIVFDLTIVMIILGIVIFVLSFAGCLGALRENVPLLKGVCVIEETIENSPIPSCV